MGQRVESGGFNKRPGWRSLLSGMFLLRAEASQRCDHTKLMPDQAASSRLARVRRGDVGEGHAKVEDHADEQGGDRIVARQPPKQTGENIKGERQPEKARQDRGGSGP